MDQRGSALLNVLAVVAMLLILGFGLMQAVNSDFVLAIRDADVTHAIQMAEGGIDYGLEMLIAGSDDTIGEPNWPGEGESSPFIIEVDEGEVEVFIEEIVPEKEYLITSRSYRENATRQIKAYVTRYGDVGVGFTHSLFIGGEGLDPGAEVELKNLVIHGDVYIAIPKVYLSGVTFNGNVHFASQEVHFSGNNQLSIQAKATAEHDTNVYGVNASHWASNMQRVPNRQELPDVEISDLKAIADEDFSGETSVSFSQLKRVNYFDRDVTINFVKNTYPSEVKMVVACEGSVTFNAPSDYQVDMDRILIVMAGVDISGVEKITKKADKKPKLDLYLYAKRFILTEQNIYPSSLMAQSIGTHSQKYEIKAPNPAVFDDLPIEVRNVWRVSGYKITKWEN